LRSGIDTGFGGVGAARRMLTAVAVSCGLLFFCSIFLDSLPKLLMDNKFAVIGDHVHPIWPTYSSDLAELIFPAIGNGADRN